MHMKMKYKHKILPGIVVLFGFLFLLEALGAVTALAVNLIWPILVIVAGLLLYSRM